MPGAADDSLLRFVPSPVRKTSFTRCRFEESSKNAQKFV